MNARAPYIRWLKGFLQENPEPDNAQMNFILRRLAIWRTQMLVNTFVHHHGLRVLRGPFRGMDYVGRATEGALMPRLLGSYESELHPFIEEFAAGRLDCVIDIGCAEGYYAVGLACLMPEVQVHAFDIDDRAREACAALAAKNGVGERVIVGGAFGPEDFARFEGRRCLVWIDAEGYEDEVLDPAASPALAGMSVIVETHDMFKPGVLQRLQDRFEATHHVRVVRQQPKTTGLPEWLTELNHLDQLLAVWEWRSGPTPWLVMTPKDWT